jgi:hypothetical protein
VLPGLYHGRLERVGTGIAVALSVHTADVGELPFLVVVVDLLVWRFGHKSCCFVAVVGSLACCYNSRYVVDNSFAVLFRGLKFVDLIGVRQCVVLVVVDVAPNSPEL